MNKIQKLYIYFMLAGSLIITSCSNFLDIQPTGKVIPNTLEEYRALMTTVYSKGLIDRSLCDMRTGDITIRNDEFDQSTYRDIERWVANNPSGTEFGWSSYYENIYYANAIINKQNDITEGTKEDIDQLVGEAYFMRGYMHFILVNLFGQPYTKEGAPMTKAVPLKLTLDLEELPTRNTVEQIYISILSDIENARKFINRTEWETGFNYRFSTLAVDAFESRVCLYKGDWKTAYDVTERLLAQKSTLEDFNSSDFKMPNLYESMESITAYENVYNNSTLKASQATEAFVKMFQEGDLRLAKYIDVVNADGNYPIIKNDGTSKYKCSFRTSELYLNAAEAAAHLNKLPEARNRLLQLMEKRYTPTAYEQKENEVSNMNQAHLITEILNERARELAFEGHRWFDLRRTTRPEIKKIFNEQTIVLQQDDVRYTLQIPLSATNANPNLMD
ncbi:RagB/SusD family nutrient uptake outer membrane protein [Bacteroides sp.]|uniref:RagB/SusD family nutrient uptake outer membrane protein n=1 Tax=Bacteroides sp. TaxID=29523 RepID=UPI002612845D|nr:RagB/SusD family nutrient uptake outer membrane protein [Bacteroides sp.]MDD3039887.1 RagB/SusD family nutrient uptake outer membrane protein [Bacteroides sp.]